MKKKILPWAIVLAAGALVAALVVNYMKNLNTIGFGAAYEYSQINAVMSVMKEKKLLEKYMPGNVKVKWSMFDSGSDRRDALATEKVAIGVLENTKAITSIENGYPIEVLAGGTMQTTGVYSANPDVKSAKDLKGKKIAYPGTKNLILKNDFKDYYNITISEDDLIQVGEADMISMLVQGQVDGAVLTNTMVVKAQGLSGDVHLVRDLTSETEKLGVANWFIGSSDYFEKHPELLEPAMKAYEEAINLINEDPHAMAEMLAPLFEIDAQLIEDEFRAFPPNTGVYGYDEVAKVLLENGDLDQEAAPFTSLPNYSSIPKKKASDSKN